MNGKLQQYKPCERCGRPCMIGGNPRPIIVCRDCRSGDPEWLRIVAAKTKVGAA